MSEFNMNTLMRLITREREKEMEAERLYDLALAADPHYSAPTTVADCYLEKCKKHRAVHNREYSLSYDEYKTMVDMQLLQWKNEGRQ